MADSLAALRRALADRYTVLGELGRGGMATVYLAEDLKHHRKVAIKVLRPELAATLGPERFLREIEVAAQLQHPHILPLHDSGQVDGILFYVMPYVEGQSLRERLVKEGELPVGEVVRILREVVDALSAAHARGVIHRDVKPENILLGGRHALVADFGLAKALSEATGRQELTSSGMTLGTPAYMAPEQVVADPHIDHRADIYAVGALAYELLTGRPPFAGRTAQAVLAAHVTEVPEPLTTYREAVPPALEQLVMRCLEKKPADRWQRADELLQQLEILTAPSGGTTPAAAPPPVVSDHDVAAWRSHPVRVAALFGLAAAGILATVYVLVMRLGLPNWVFGCAVGLLVIGLPVVLVTGHQERRRALARAAGARTEERVAAVRRVFTWPRVLLGGAIAFGALGAAAAGYMAMRVLGIGPVGTLVASGVLEERERLVLAQFANTTSDTTLAGTVTELFHIDLTQSPTVSVLEASQVGAVLRRMNRDPNQELTPALATEVAEREGIKAVLAGEIRPLGSGYVVSARLVAVATGDVLWAGREAAGGADGIIESVDRLSASLRKRVGESLRSVRSDPPLDRVTTRSTVALRKLVEGTRASELGDADRAIALLEEAIVEDSGFAMAWRKLAVVLNNAGRDAHRAESAFAMALRLGDRLTERERYLTQGTYFQLAANDIPAAIGAYRSVLARYPDDQIALNNLAVIYDNLGRAEEAAELRLRSVALGHAPAATYQNAVISLYELGKRDSALRILDLYAEEYPDHPMMLACRAAFASAAGLYDSAQATLEHMRSMQRGNPQMEMVASFGLANLATVRGRIGEGTRQRQIARARAEEAGLQWTRDQPRDFWLGGIEARNILQYANDPDSAVRLMNAALAALPDDSLDPENRQYLTSAVFFARAGRSERARQYLMAYQAEVDVEAREREAARWHAGGEVALAEGRHALAVQQYHEFRRASPGCVLCGLLELAEAFDRAGEPDSAVAYYEQYLEAPALFRLERDSNGRWRALRGLGELHEALGHRDAAVGYYSQLIDLWRDADPMLQPLVAEARKAVARLTAEPREWSPTR